MTTRVYPLRKALATNSSSTAFTAKIPTASEPDDLTNGKISLFDRDLGLALDTYAPSWIRLLPFGTNGNNDTFDMRLWGWSKVHGSSLWIPELLIDISVVLGNIDGSAIAADTFMADTITVNDGAADTGGFRVLIDSQEDLGASVMLHTLGCQYLEFDWDLAGAQEAATMNCFWRMVDDTAD